MITERPSRSRTAPAPRPRSPFDYGDYNRRSVFRCGPNLSLPKGPEEVGTRVLWFGASITKVALGFGTRADAGEFPGVVAVGVEKRVLGGLRRGRRTMSESGSTGGDAVGPRGIPDLRPSRSNIDPGAPTGGRLVGASRSG